MPGFLFTDQQFMNISEITSIEDPRVSIFSSMTDKELGDKRNRKEGVFIAESPKVIRTALSAGYHPLAMLCEKRHIAGDAADIASAIGNTPIYTGSRDTLAGLTGYTLTRGVLCAMQRRPERAVEEICRDAKRIAVIDSVTDTTNIGAIFRSAAALGIDGVLLTPQSCDPLNRRSVRVSMGSVFLVPWTWADNPVQTLRDLGFKSVSMALTDNSIPITNQSLKKEPRLAIILGTEGDGLSDKVISDSDYVARIPMSHGVDSLNVAAASAVAFWELRCEKQPTRP